jgi:hypothetical protein
LADAPQTGTEILFPQQFHSASDNPQRFDNTEIKQNEINGCKYYQGFYRRKQVERRRGIENLAGEGRQNSDQQNG